MPRYQSYIVVIYTFINIYFSILFVWACLSTYAHLYFPSIIFTVCSYSISLFLFLFWYFFYIHKHLGAPDEVKSLIRLKVRSYLYLFLLAILYILLFVPKGFNEIYPLYIIAPWLFSLLFIGITFMSDTYYLWLYAAKGDISVKYISNFRLFSFLTWVCHFTGGYFLLWHYSIDNIYLPQMVSSFIMFMNRIPFIGCIIGELEESQIVLRSKNEIIRESLQQSIILSTKFYKFIVIPVLSAEILLLIPFLKQMSSIFIILLLQIIIVSLLLNELYQQNKKRRSGLA